MTTEENKQFMLHFVEEVLNKKNLDALEDIAAPDFVEQVPFPGQGPGREGLRQVLAAFIRGFPDMHWTIEEQIAEGEKVVSRFTMTGTHQGEFLGIPATHKPVQVWGVVMDVVRDGKFVESRMIMDMVSLLQQIGVFPPAA